MTSRITRNLIQLALLSLLFGACSNPTPRPLFKTMPTQTPQTLTTSTPIPSATPRPLFREDIPRTVIIDQIAWAPGLGGGFGPLPSWDEQATVGTVVNPVVLIMPQNAAFAEDGSYYYWQPGDVLDVGYAGFESGEVIKVVVFFSPCQWAGRDETVESFATWQILSVEGLAFEQLQIPVDWPKGHYAIMTFGKQQSRCGDWIEGQDYESKYQCSAYSMFFLGDPAEMELCFDCYISAYASVQASSILPPEQRHSYEPAKAVDGTTSTAWVEGVSGPGLGEWIELTFPRKMEIWSIDLDIGFDENQYLFYANNRIQRARLHFSDDPPIEVTTQDTRGMQYFRIPFVRTTFVRLEILDIYPGTRWNDTCLAEIEVRGR